MEPFKNHGPKTLAAKAKAQGLEPLAHRILRDRLDCVFHKAVPGIPGNFLGNPISLRSFMQEINSKLFFLLTSLRCAYRYYAYYR